MDFYKLFTFENQSQFQNQDKMQRGKKKVPYIHLLIKSTEQSLIHRRWLKKKTTLLTFDMPELKVHLRILFLILVRINEKISLLCCQHSIVNRNVKDHIDFYSARKCNAKLISDGNIKNM